MQVCERAPWISPCFKERQTVKRTYRILVLLPAWCEPLLWGGFIFKFIEQHALLQPPRSAYMRNLKGCVHVSFLPQLPGKKTGECCFTTNS